MQPDEDAAAPANSPRVRYPPVAFDERRSVLLLRAGLSRLRLQRNRLHNSSAESRREVAALLSQTGSGRASKQELARIRAEQIMRDELLQDGYEMLGVCVETLLTRRALLAQSAAAGRAARRSWLAATRRAKRRRRRQQFWSLFGVRGRSGRRRSSKADVGEDGAATGYGDVSPLPPLPPPPEVPMQIREALAGLVFCCYRSSQRSAPCDVAELGTVAHVLTELYGGERFASHVCARPEASGVSPALLKRVAHCAPSPRDVAAMMEAIAREYQVDWRVSASMARRVLDAQEAMAATGDAEPRARSSCDAGAGVAAPAAPRQRPSEYEQLCLRFRALRDA